MASLATPTQLAARLQAQVDEASAQLALDNASGLVRAVAGNQFAFISQESIDLVGGQQELVLPGRPVVVDQDNPLAVVEVTEFGGASTPLVADRDYVLTGSRLTRGMPWWFTDRLQGWPYRRPLGVWAPRVRVTYSHGYREVPADIVALVLDVAQSLYSNPGGLRSWQVPEYSETYATEMLGAATVASIRKRLDALNRLGPSAFSI
ncbi:hypothetical protein [Actinosynnema mirum]|uniref:Uncharacterized protein n=1 Tax=Actinosynnema mirum (strain ATCC 29888 / DSM 43827 / JCM 3225 / NBRC 14064 / NCIMB 13271 / NRRL B-12336 / IMRU 3971 / 101) TaxID=446462 RepID=C6WC55_ACTMD|nr:hypothetical protein [Actinosynnema mirum]ACU39443.1 hypothetical protein Amir_5627 [Actinosynnema mirum DSM 43827]